MSGISGLFKNTYGAKVAKGEIEPYKERMKAEYKQLNERYIKLRAIIDKYNSGTLAFELNCPIELLLEQASHMSGYLSVLRQRALIEKIEL